ncbi:hypothetical protein K435DRAFT_393652 [Dendrothele bispora CBS 962.96]|uniref:Uncharacterized protein n=1 Tax=Dendrothele bispora (strain CBS 962.96) TaxID=1314807 RepID=A0A4S8L8R0_DENBC|nr:hypothetical protein K435DRAFT_393652 [Dendrothele bispora CBS 962.96]
MIKLGRIVALVIFILRYLGKTRAMPSDDPLKFFLVISRMGEPKVVWGLQILDNGSVFFHHIIIRSLWQGDGESLVVDEKSTFRTCSFLFMYRLHQIRSFSLRLSHCEFKILLQYYQSGIQLFPPKRKNELTITNFRRSGFYFFPKLPTPNASERSSSSPSPTSFFPFSSRRSNSV